MEAGYISSDESAHGADLAERLRVKPSRDIWELGKKTFLVYEEIAEARLVQFTFIIYCCFRSLHDISLAVKKF